MIPPPPPSSSSSSQPRFYPRPRVARRQYLTFVLVGGLFLVVIFLSLLEDEPPVFAFSSISSSLGLKQGSKTSNSNGSSSSSSNISSTSSQKGTVINEKSESYLPPELFDLGLYHQSDFVNEIGISPPFWKPDPYDGSGQTWGPCYPQYDDDRKRHHHHQTTKKKKIDWFDDRNNTSVFEYVYNNPRDKRWKGPDGKSGLCRPGFIILGAGKCGTSSLYHYLLGHPRVVPALEKQIHYFIRPIEWYYSWFPTATSFLQHGALITGEASPGYLPYPKAAKVTRDRMVGNPKLVAIGRNPLTRMYSSYRYNYRYPALVDLKKREKRESVVDAHHHPDDDEYYEQNYLFSFEELVKAELVQLRNCLDGFGIVNTRNEWYRHNWTRSEFDQREKQGLDPLIDLDLVCYGPQLNKTVLREQWIELQMKHPERYIPATNAFLIQSIIGRSLYVLALEWWYILFDSRDIVFYCTEDLTDVEKFNDLSMQLGLPSYNYSNVVAQGAFNVGGHRGYDKATPWKELKAPEDHAFSTTATAHKDHSSKDEDKTNASDDAGIPLSAELRQEVLDFIQPYNERLFRLVGKRCDWTSV